MEKNYDITREGEIYGKWESAGVFKPKGDKGPYTILMPPPNANASLHSGHGMYTVDDIMVRFKRMQGYAALWVPGRDHAGFETQYVYEKHLAKEGKSRLDFDRQALYDKVFKFVEDNSGLIFEQFKRLGFSADWDRSVFTLDQQVIDRVFETFVKMEREGLVYRSDYMVNYCTYCGTSLAELEVKHVEREDPLYYVRYPLASGMGYITVATVRPETIFADTALAIHPDNKKTEKYRGKTVINPLSGERLTVIEDEMVDPEFGTGVVKITPAHDPDDYQVGLRHKLGIKQVIDQMGRMRVAYPGHEDYNGLKVKAAREKAVEELQNDDMIENVDTHYSHSVTVCYKCGRDLEPTIITNWFVKVGSLKPAVIEAVKEKKTRFYPKRFEKHFLTWMEMMHDWPISRQIAWGIRIPVWYSIKANGGTLKVTFLDKEGKRVVGFTKVLLENYSFEEIEKGLQNVSAPPGAAYVVSKIKPVGDFLQETDTFDTWFSSGQWPLVTLTKEEMKTRFPTDLMGTLSDILKFWISRMMMFSLYLRDEVPFKQVYLWPMVADSKGVKMSKSKGNVINPIDLVDKYGADAFRMSLLYGSGEGGKIILSEDKVRGMRNFANKIWNAARFVIMLKEGDIESSGSGDIEFYRHLNRSIDGITNHLEGLRIGTAAEWAYDGFWHWYCDEAIEKAKVGEISQRAILDGLEVFLKLLHPFVPFVTEAVWQELGHKEMLVVSKWPAATMKG